MMTISPAHYARVRTNLAFIEAAPEMVAQIFYTELFRAAPDLRKLWAGEMLAQSQKLIADLTTAIAVLDTPEALRPFLADLALHHRANGLSPAGYFAIHVALMEMVSHFVGCDDATYDAWDDAFTLILSEMLGAAHGPEAYSDVLPLAA